MALTGLLGTSDSQLGNILLGAGGMTVDLAVTFNGSSSVAIDPKNHVTLSVEFHGGSRIEVNSLEFFYVLDAEFLPSSSVVLVNFSSPFSVDPQLLDPASYTITGPSAVTILEVFTAGTATIALMVSGTISGTYTVDVIGVIHSFVRGLLSPGPTSALFLAEIPYTARSIFTDKGPIAKPEGIVQFGTKWSVQTVPTRFFGNITTSDVVIPGANLDSSHVGLYLRLKATVVTIDQVNGGDYKILGVVNSTRATVQASFRAPSTDPDDNVSTNYWAIVDPNTGFIADSPSDVTVRVNGTPVSIDYVVGLLGQIILTDPPAHGSSISVDYSWVNDPAVEFRRLNSLEFVSNRWNRAMGVNGKRVFPYRNAIQSMNGAKSRILIDDIRAPQPQPLLRELFYRAYERAYTALSNDPTSLLLNTPNNRVAFPPLSRQISQVSVAYDANTLPEVDSTTPWDRKGTGTASVSSGLLTVISDTTGPFPDGQPFYWSRGVDLTFPHAYATTWRLAITATVPDGVFTGVCIGWSDSIRAVVLGYLLDGSTRKIGFLLRGNGDDPSLITGWTTFDFDWSTIHSYRLFRDTSGVINFYVDGEVVPNLSVSEDQLPFLEELNDSFNEIQNIFFGSLSRAATSTSVWDFVHYLVLPTNPQQSIPSSFVSYTPTVFPEDSTIPWTPVGYHGNETLVGGVLVLDSTSATDLATSEEVGLVGGDFKGFTRIEPLLSASTNTVLDFEVILRTFTHGITQNAIMVAVDDGNRLVQVCFFPTTSQPKVSYPGRSLPQEATPRPWTSLGGQPAVMVGRTLQIQDSSLTDGRVFAIEDLEPSVSPDRIFDTSIDYYFEFKCEVLSSTPDPTDYFCGATTDVYDGVKTIGVMLRRDPINPQVAFHSDGFILQAFPFNWADGQPHIYRVVKNTVADLVTLFIDGVFIGSYAYSGFTTISPVSTPTFSFGSSTASSGQALSVVEWHYVNGWRAQPISGVSHYVGIWKGADPNSLLGYYLPLKALGQANTSGNQITDLLADFIGSGVQIGDDLIIDFGDNRGVYSVLTVSTNTITFANSFPQPGHTVVEYRIPAQFEWVMNHTYQLLRDPAGFIALFVDSSTTPIIQVEYNHTTLPSSSVGLPSQFNSGLPSVTWGAFDPTNLSQSAWTFMQYGITRAPIEVKAVPPHQVSNQRNVMSSPEHLFGTVAHNHTQYSSASTGVPYLWEEYVNNPNVHAFTKLNEGTPLVPSTQTYDVRKKTIPPFPPYSATGFGGAALGTDGFGFGSVGVVPSFARGFNVPPGVLYNRLEVIERTSGEPNLLSAFSDDEVSMVFSPPVVSLAVSFSGDSGLMANPTVPHFKVHSRTVVVSMAGNLFTDSAANFISYDIQSGDHLVITSGPNSGVYQIESVSALSLRVTSNFPTTTTTSTSYNIPTNS